MADLRIRSITKAIVFRILSTITTFTLAYVFTGKLAQSLVFVLFNAIINTILYFAHERIWTKIKWGKKKWLKKKQKLT